MSGVKPEMLIDNVFVDYSSGAVHREEYGVVYPGTWRGRPVVVKVPHHVFFESPANCQTFLPRFGSVCMLHRDLRHECVEKFFGVTRSCTRSGTPALVTERLDTTLEYRYRAASMTLAELLSILCDASAGLEYIHSRGVIHGNMTTSNVRLTHGPRRRAKVCDFSLSRYLGRGSDLTEVPEPLRMLALDTEVTVCGPSNVILYMPPEVCSHNPRYGQKLDVFTFGVLMMCVVLGREPPVSLMVAPRHVLLPNGKYKAVREIERRRGDFDAMDTRHPLRDLIARCLINDPDLRRALRSFTENCSELGIGQLQGFRSTFHLLRLLLLLLTMKR